MDKKISYIKERVLEIADYKGISKEKFIENFGMTYGNFKGKQKLTSLNSDFLDKILSEISEINPEWLLTGKGEMLKSEPELSEKQKKVLEIKQQLQEGTLLKKKKNLIPFYEDVSTIGGTLLGADTSPISHPTTYIDAGDWFKQEVSAAIRHYGDSMIEYPNGCILALKKITNQRNIVWGRNYVVETDEIRVTKRLQTCPNDLNCIMAYSTNTSTYPDGTLIHEPFKIRKEDIRQVFLVLGSINKEYGSEAVWSFQ